MKQNELIAELCDKDDNKAYARTKEIIEESLISDIYYPYLEAFAALLGSNKSYLRVRGLLLCCAQARWDKEKKIGKLLPELLALLSDPKPSVVRQSIKAFKTLIPYCPEINDALIDELNKIDLSEYKESMAGLIRKDRDELLALCKQQTENGVLKKEVPNKAGNN